MHIIIAGGCWWVTLRHFVQLPEQGRCQSVSHLARQVEVRCLPPQGAAPILMTRSQTEAELSWEYGSGFFGLRWDRLQVSCIHDKSLIKKQQLRSSSFFALAWFALHIGVWTTRHKKDKVCRWRLGLNCFTSEPRKSGHCLGKPVAGYWLQIKPAALQWQTLTLKGNGKESGVLILLIQREQH